MSEAQAEAGEAKKPNDLTEEELKVRPLVARALFLGDTANEKFGSHAAKNAAFKEVRGKYIIKANKLLRRLKANGVSFSVTEKETA